MALASIEQSETKVEFLSRAMKRLGLEMTFTGSERHKFAKRPGIGLQGKKIDLIANYFPIDIPEGEIYHYDVHIEKLVPVKDAGDSEGLPKHKKYKCQNTKQKRNVIEAMIRDVAMFKNILPAFDGEKNLYTRNLLPFKKEKTFTVKLTDDFNPKDKISYEIQMKPVNRKDTMKRSAENSINLEPLHQLLAGRCSDITEGILMGIMAIETILRHGPALRLVPVGRSFFTKPHSDEVPLLSGGREIWFGHHQSMQLCQWKPMLNIDKSATTFYKSCSVIEFMFEVLNMSTENIELSLRQFRSLTDAERRTLAKEMKNLRVEVTHLPYPRKYRVRDITRENANNTFFIRKIDNEDVRCSVSEYFRTTYRKLQYPNLPCLNVGSEKKAVHLPMEVCNIVEGQHCNKKLTEKQTSDMIRYTARPPAQRFNDIKESINAVLKDFEPFSREFGIRVSPKPVNFTGRVLNAPQITYQQNQAITPFNGSWDMKGKRFFTGASIEKWMLLSFSTARFCDENALDNFVRMLINGGRNVGVYFAPPLVTKRFTHRDGRPADLLRRAKNMYKDLQLAVIVLPAGNIYSEIKTVAETELGLMTQCIKDVNATGRKCNPQLICNLCQKINAKMGEVNNSLSQADKPAIFKKPVIIVGVDCTHPAPGDKTGYSIAAVVGSLDSYPSKFTASVRLQHKRQKVEGKTYGQDIVIDLKEMMKEILLEFFKTTKGKKPEKIIIFRDGISEGEYQNVMEYEMRKIRNACKEMAQEETYEPPITFIVIDKRHHTRLLPTDPRDGVGRPGNVPPGTIVDTNIVHPFFYDFFLCSHIGIQGTSRPSHYTVLWDDNNFTADQLQLLTYSLCHTYVRCTRSISVPCPVMYAHLAAFRAKHYLIAKTEDVSSSETSESEGEEVIIPESMKEAIRVVKSMQNRMYFV
ncbi:protein argonaute-2-like isoform X4 [Centruroides sculpturatus]|uniref:protein argonaute-2-like isoform X4 n=1 Tax=Centruroides sculpturatus TaxID=218467 RepID=UPI000C6D6244|nr:protein argonaute-2-like isoform X4 [Centruroides sculpturatus]